MERRSVGRPLLRPDLSRRNPLDERSTESVAVVTLGRRKCPAVLRPSVEMMMIKEHQRTPPQWRQLVMYPIDWRHYHVVWQCLASGQIKSQPLCNLPTVPHIVVVVGLECFSDLWGYAGRAIHAWLDRIKVRFQNKKDTWVHAVRGGSRFTSGTRLVIRRDCACESATA